MGCSAHVNLSLYYIMMVRVYTDEDIQTPLRSAPLGGSNCTSWVQRKSPKPNTSVSYQQRVPNGQRHRRSGGFVRSPAIATTQRQVHPGSVEAMANPGAAGRPNSWSCPLFPALTLPQGVAWAAWSRTCRYSWTRLKMKPASWRWSWDSRPWSHRSGTELPPGLTRQLYRNATNGAVVPPLESLPTSLHPV